MDGGRENKIIFVWGSWKRNFGGDDFWTDFEVWVGDF